MQKILKSKWIYLIVGILLVALFEGNITKLTVADRAIIVGMSVDYENHQLVVNSQVVLPSNSPQTTRSGMYAVFEARGDTLEGALSQLSEHIGLEASLAHCLVMVLGKEVVNTANFSSLAYLFTPDRVPDKMYIISTEEEAKTILQANVPVGEVSSFHLSKTLMSQRRSFGVNPINIKDFFVNYYSESGANFMPIANRVKVDLPNMPNTSTPTGDEVYVMELARTAILDRNGLQLILNEDESKALSLITARINKGSFSLQMQDGDYISVNILQSSVKKHFDLQSRTAEFEVSVKAKIADRAESFGIGIIEQLTDKEAEALARQMEIDILKCFTNCKNQGVDVYNLYDGFFKKYGKKWQDMAEQDYLQGLNIKAKVKIVKK